MTVSVHVEPTTSGIFVRLDGAADVDLLAHLGDAVATLASEAVGSVVMDLDRLTVLHPSGLHELVDQLLDAAHGRVMVLATRSSLRRLLTRWGIAARVPVRRTLPRAMRETP